MLQFPEGRRSNEEGMPRQNSPDITEQCPAQIIRIAADEKVRQRIVIGPRVDAGVRQDCLDFRCGDKPFPGFQVVEGPDAHDIARQHHLLPLHVEQGESVVAVQFCREQVTELPVAGHHEVRIRQGRGLGAQIRAQFTDQVRAIVQAPVEAD